MIEGTNSVKLNNPSIQGSTVSNNNNPQTEKEGTTNPPATPVVTSEVSEDTMKMVDQAWTNYAIAGININKSTEIKESAKTEGSTSVKTAEEYLAGLTPEERADLEERINREFLEKFEPGVVHWLNVYKEEFGGKFTNLPEDEQMALAGAAFANNDEAE